MTEIHSVCVYCGSSFGQKQAYLSEAQAFGALLAKSSIRLVYGGGGVGLMGAVARSCHDEGGSVLGIMPRFLRSREILYDTVETRIVETMHERKMMMFDESDAFVVLPGGIGTLEEVIELLSWRRLDLHNKPVIFLNTDNYWDPLFQMIDHTQVEGFCPPSFGATYEVASHYEEILPLIHEMASQKLVLDTRIVI
jgi:uncharacterized protein (TIGR00730 family)